MRRLIGVSCGTVLMVTTFSGCGPSSERPDVLAPVSGVVMIANQPAAGVGVTFIPVNGTRGTGASGATDETGTFTLLHQTGTDGIEPGTYKVIFSRWRMPNGDPIPDGQSAADVNAIDTIPLLYRDPERTTFIETIAADGKLSRPFRL